ncbi:MAG TPA: RNA pseudouridine synthase [Sulfurospirillum sp. UBA12182]|jgi:23S rRNA-/tRNA-specific pseudouridylate synthase|nr:MAG TPA: RNA pseudouridine synthase [Sulfurospirillum sp. UBA12182]
MSKEKAYKLLALQENISNRAAKDLIDRGLVYSGGRKITVARGELDAKTKFKVNEIKKAKKIFEDENIIAVDKPAFLNTEELVSSYEDATLLHRLDRETSGVLLFSKNEEFHKKAVEAFKNKEVKKEYIAIVSGVFVEPITINMPLVTIKKGNSAYAKISLLKGKEAISHVEPLMVEGKISKVKVTIETGRTHQIRAHLKSANMSIIGDTLYGGKPSARIMLHAHKISLLGYEFKSEEPKEFIKMMQRD